MDNIRIKIVAIYTNDHANTMTYLIGDLSSLCVMSFSPVVSGTGLTMYKVIWRSAILSSFQPPCVLNAREQKPQNFYIFLWS